MLTPEGETDAFKSDTGVLQGDPLAPFLFIIVLDYAPRTFITSSDGLTIKPCQSRRYPAENFADLDYADDIALLEDCIEAAQDLLKRVEKACQEVGLHLNTPKTQYRHLNPSSDTPSLHQMAQKSREFKNSSRIQVTWRLLATMADRLHWHLDYVCVSPEPSGIG